MSVLVYISPVGTKVSKASAEAVYYGSQLGPATIITHGPFSPALNELGKFGAAKVLRFTGEISGEASQLVALISSAAQTCNATTIVVSHDLTGRSVAPRLSARLKAGAVIGAVSLPDSAGKIKVNVFSGKAVAIVKVNTAQRVISLTPNSIPVTSGASVAPVEDFNCDCGSPLLKTLEVKKQEGELLLPEAELVVSGGRGLKGPENWGVLENLAKALGAATACSRPVADVGWRPHHEHVGQTGIAIRPNLYIAVGISGAIQHLAGVNGSKVIVVINTDPEAPFFKAADYGVVGDAFDVLPKLTDEIKKFKSQNG